VGLWREAEPKSPVWRGRTLAEYLNGGAARRVWLAGAYMGMPWADGAGETDVWGRRPYTLWELARYS